MAIWECGQCGTLYAVGMPSCPHCQTVSEELKPPAPKRGRPRKDSK